MCQNQPQAKVGQIQQIGEWYSQWKASLLQLCKLKGKSLNSWSLCKPQEFKWYRTILTLKESNKMKVEAQWRIKTKIEYQFEDCNGKSLLKSVQKSFLLALRCGYLLFLWWKGIFCQNHSLQRAILQCLPNPSVRENLWFRQQFLCFSSLEFSFLINWWYPHLMKSQILCKD